MPLGNPSNATADTNNHDHYLIQRTVQALDYSDNLGLPVWASWRLTATDIGTNARSTFLTDTNLPANFYRVTPVQLRHDRPQDDVIHAQLVPLVRPPPDRRGLTCATHSERRTVRARR